MSTTTKALNLPHINVDKLNKEDLHKEIRSIGVIAHFFAQGICDERYYLAERRVSKKNPNPPPPHRCNHFSLWFFIEGKNAVMVDVIAEKYTTFDPMFVKDAEIKTDGVQAVVRISSKNYDSEPNVGCVVENFTVARGLTVQHIINLICIKGRQFYKFQPDYKRQVGCRYWVHTLCKDMQAARWVLPEHSQIMEDGIRMFYDRRRYETSGGRVHNTDGWDLDPEHNWDYLPAGTFYQQPCQDATHRQEQLGPVLLNNGRRGKCLFVD